MKTKMRSYLAFPQLTKSTILKAQIANNFDFSKS
jgi:hypothetical protein